MFRRDGAHPPHSEKCMQTIPSRADMFSLPHSHIGAKVTTLQGTSLSLDAHSRADSLACLNFTGAGSSSEELTAMEMWHGDAAGEALEDDADLAFRTP